MPITAPFSYTFPIDRLIHRYKHQRCRYSGQLLARLTHCHSALPGTPELLVPIPLSWRRLLWRGFNQAEALTVALSRRHRIPWRNLLTRQHRPAQQQQRRAMRRRNPVGAFQCRQPLRGLHICLVDDVVTTGSTLAAAAEALRRAGAGDISAWCLARTLPNEALS